jgi:phosphate transport system substrate-binding protein
MRVKSVALTAAVSATAMLAAASADAQSRDQIRIVGSSTVYPFATTVAERFGETTEYPAPIIESTGSGGGLQLFCQGIGLEHPDITNASRAIKDSEVELCRENGVENITEITIGYDGIVLATADESQAMDLTLAQVWQALAATTVEDGELVENPNETWADIDSSLPDTEITVFGPPPTSGTRDAFVELAMEEGCMEFEVVENLEGDRQEEVCAQMREDGAFIEAGENDNLIVERLQAEPGTHGIFGFSFLDQNRDLIQANAIRGNDPTFDTIASGDYPLSRPLFFYVKNAHVGVVPGMMEYLQEFTSDRAMGPDGYLADKGLIPLDEGRREEVRSNVAALGDQQ